LQQKQTTMNRMASFDTPSIRVNFSRQTVLEQQATQVALQQQRQLNAAWSAAPLSLQRPLARVGALAHPALVTSVAVSPSSASMVASGDECGVVRVWHAESGRMLSEMCIGRDDAARTFGVSDLQWSDDESVLVVCGVAGDRTVWSRVDDANQVTRAPIVVIDVASSTVLCTLDGGHASEVWSVRCVDVCGLRCVVSAGEDGKVMRWQLAANYAALVKMTVLIDQDLAADSAFCIAFAPDCANKYAVVATDNAVTLYDVQHCFAVQRFNNLYTHMCSFVAFAPPTVSLPLRADGSPLRRCNDLEWFLVTSGLEATDDYAVKQSRAAANVPPEQRPPATPVRPSCAHMRRLSAPTSNEGDWSLEELHEYAPHGYEATHFPMRCHVDGAHLYLPCDSGHVVVVATDAPVVPRDDAERFVDLTRLIGASATRANEQHAVERQSARLARTPYSAVATGTAVRAILKPDAGGVGTRAQSIAANAVLQRLYVAQGRAVSVFGAAPSGQ
jgi:hypothetical protein